jgi:hypothetical protein
VTYLFNRPPARVTGFLLLIRPLIFVQLIALKAWVREQYGPGERYRHTISRWGRVSLRHMPIDFAERSYAAAGALRPLAFDFTLSTSPKRFALALTPESQAPMPAHGRSPEIPSVHVAYALKGFDTS